MRSLFNLVALEMSEGMKCNNISLVFVFGPLRSPAHVWGVVCFIVHFASSTRVVVLYSLRLEFREESCASKAVTREGFG